MKHPESIIQAQFVVWLKLQFPSLLFTGGFDAARLRPQQGMRRKMAGYRPGTPDIFILERNSAYAGLLIEIKATGGRLSPTQIDFHNHAVANGYCVAVCYSLAEAQAVLVTYLQGRK